MRIDTDFFAGVLEKFANENVIIHLCNSNARIIASTDQASVGRKSVSADFALQETRSVIIGGEENEEDLVTYASIIKVDHIHPLAIVLIGDQEKVTRLGNIIKTVIETTLSYQYYITKEAMNTDERALIGQTLVDGNFTEQNILSKMNRLELVPNLLRCVIYIDLLHDEPTYFNVQLNLGYQSSVARKNEEIIRQLAKGKYFNTQDLIFLYDRNTVLIIKSFVTSSDIQRAYLALDKICLNVSDILRRFTSLKYHISYGNLYPNLSGIRRSFLEAYDTMLIGKSTLPNEEIYSLEDLLFEHICKDLNPQISNKLIQSYIGKLTEGEKAFPIELIETAEAFVDNCMNINQTSKKIYLHRNTISKRLMKLKEKTSLDPQQSFRDAFLIKMISAYMKLHGQM